MRPFRIGLKGITDIIINKNLGAQIPGILRGLLRSSYPVTRGFKIADIDPRREELSNCFLISDKSRCIAGSVLELVCAQVWQ